MIKKGRIYNFRIVQFYVKVFSLTFFTEDKLPLSKEMKILFKNFHIFCMFTFRGKYHEMK